MSDVKLGERLFTIANPDRVTVDHHLAQMAVIAASGLDRLLPEEDEDPQHYLLRVNGQMLVSGKSCDLLALHLLPVGTSEIDWTPDMAADTRRYLGRLDTREAREQVYVLALEFVFGFFKRGADSLLTSQRFSESLDGADPSTTGDVLNSVNLPH